MKTLMMALLVLASTTVMAGETAAPTADASSVTTPKQVCEALAKAATENNYNAFTEWTAMPMMAEGCMMHGKGKGKECTEKNCPMHKGSKGKGKDSHHAMMMPNKEMFEKMHATELEKLKGLSCKDEKIVGDHAWVEAATQSESRLVPFKMVDGKWKFDIHTYHAFYNPMTAHK